MCVCVCVWVWRESSLARGKVALFSREFREKDLGRRRCENLSPRIYLGNNTAAKPNVSISIEHFGTIETRRTVFQLGIFTRVIKKMRSRCTISEIELN